MTAETSVPTGPDATKNRRTLVILRHAKADRPGGVPDIERPLTSRGHADAAVAGAWLATRGYRPDLVLCSPSRRTRQTWHGVAVALKGEPPVVRYENVLYEDGPGHLLDLVRGAGSEFGTVLVVGHNPTVSLLSAVLDPAEGHDSDGLRTSGIAVHQWDGTWSTCEPGTARLIASHTAHAEQ
jgi:phosphohistidine phosphatase